ncbi:MAG TPA: hypothetical protein DEO33_00825 [Rikenellaceae bacterium]|nr:hypothetical protein [Rikenellaceae bacterium]
MTKLEEKEKKLKELAAKNKSTPEERKKTLDRLNRIAKKPEHVKRMVDFLKITGQIPGITPEEEKEYWDNIRKKS